MFVPKGNRLVRPTTDRVKESIFSILREQVFDANFLDLCAGTGSMGIEALSRGAKHVTFLDRDPRCIAIIERNLNVCGLTTESDPRYYLFCRDVLKGVASLHKQKAVFEVIYFDPPYGVGLRGKSQRHHIELYAAGLALLAETVLLGSAGTLLVEHARQTDTPHTVGSLHKYRQTRYGDTVVSFYCWEHESRIRDLELD